MDLEEVHLQYDHQTELSLPLLLKRGLLDMPLGKAAERLGLSSGALKRTCRKLGMKRWPYRQRSSLRRLMIQTEEHMGEDLGKVKRREIIRSLQAQIDDIKSISQQGILESTRRFRQVIFKLNHKNKKQREPTPARQQTSDRMFEAAEGVLLHQGGAEEVPHSRWGPWPAEVQMILESSVIAPSWIGCEDWLLGRAMLQGHVLPKSFSDGHLPLAWATDPNADLVEGAQSLPVTLDSSAQPGSLCSFLDPTGARKPPTRLIDSLSKEELAWLTSKTSTKSPSPHFVCTPPEVRTTTDCPLSGKDPHPSPATATSPSSDCIDTPTAFQVDAGEDNLAEWSSRTANFDGMHPLVDGDWEGCGEGDEALVELDWDQLLRLPASGSMDCGGEMADLPLGEACDRGQA